MAKPPRFEPAAYLPLLRVEITALAAALHTGNLQVTVPSCPDWQLADLGRHVGAVYRWAASCIATGAPSDFPTGPADDGLVPGWYDEGARLLLDRLSGTDPAAPTWHFGPKPRYAGFWFRRQTLETAVHRWDAQAAIDTPGPFDPSLAADGIAEVVEVYFPRLLRGGRGPDTAGVLTLAPTDVADADVSARNPDGHTAAGEAVVRASASDLLLLVWGRKRLADPAMRVEGDHRVADAFFATGLLP